MNDLDPLDAPPSRRLAPAHLLVLAVAITTGLAATVGLVAWVASGSPHSPGAQQGARPSGKDRQEIRDPQPPRGASTDFRAAEKVVLDYLNDRRAKGSPPIKVKEWGPHLSKAEFRAMLIEEGYQQLGNDMVEQLSPDAGIRVVIDDLTMSPEQRDIWMAVRDGKVSSLFPAPAMGPEWPKRLRLSLRQELEKHLGPRPGTR